MQAQDPSRSDLGLPSSPNFHHSLPESSESQSRQKYRMFQSLMSFRSDRSRGSQSNNAAAAFQESEETINRERSRATSNATATARSARWWKVRLFRGMVNDIKRRAPYYWSDWKDAWDYRVIPATVYMYFAKYGPTTQLLSLSCPSSPYEPSIPFYISIIVAYPPLAAAGMHNLTTGYIFTYCFVIVVRWNCLPCI